MEVSIQLDFYGVDLGPREALRGYAESQVRRAFHGDRDTITRATLTLRREHLPGSPERWSAHLELASRWGAAHDVRVSARSSRPQGAIADAIVEGWSELHARDVREVG
jgi:hypothetical protein